VEKDGGEKEEQPPRKTVGGNNGNLKSDIIDDWT
jgi:hypothetical protein